MTARPIYAAAAVVAAATPTDFGATFSTLMGRHLVGGIRMTQAVFDGDGLSASQWAAVRRPQRLLA